MGKMIAVAGKGGTGKTLVAALLIRYLVDDQRSTVLAIDADPSTNLDLTLGTSIDETVGGIREETAQQVSSGTFVSGISKPEYLELRINQALVEEEGFDLLAMGRPEGPGCYCAANNMLRATIDRLSRSYDYVIIDNEAGLEHLSRRTTQNVDLLLIISDPTMRGLSTAERVAQLIHELKTHVGHIRLMVNRVPTDEQGVPALAPQLQQFIADSQLKLAGLIPLDPLVAEFDATGRPLVELPEDTPARRAVKEAFDSLDGLL
ncbi:MAG: AAA family ATPase [Anaerolineae bacterium]|nr:AAA family ATPase [Anaerolineae bacterium]NIN99417.1 AAA family ATPase [Anaerolineae bacterium]NIQ82282.1 AAA family ATPase [Anaerolineae bacterium]